MARRAGHRRATVALVYISHRLRTRDYTIARLLTDHQALTTSVLGARYVALARDDPPPSVKTVHERADRILASPYLDHLLGANDLFVQLLAHARRHPATRLARWWSERDASPRFDRIRPDGHGVWVDHDRQVGFFLEHDTGSEPLTTLVAKLARYRRLTTTGGPHYPVLFVLPNRTRETNLHRRLSDGVDPGVLVATTNPDAGSDPAARVWQVYGHHGSRLPLGELPSDHGQPGPKNPGPPTDADDPLHALHS